MSTKDLSISWSEGLTRRWFFLAISFLFYQNLGDLWRSGLLREEEEIQFSSSWFWQLGSLPGLSPGCIWNSRWRCWGDGARMLPPFATHLRDTDKILSISILRFSTSFTSPLSGPCLTFSRPIKYKHFGVRSKSRFTPCKERYFKKVDRCVNVTTLGVCLQMKGSCLG